jgi:hypothetical protein
MLNYIFIIFPYLLNIPLTAESTFTNTAGLVYNIIVRNIGQHKFCTCSSVDRAFASGAKGRRFKSSQVHKDSANAESFSRMMPRHHSELVAYCIIRLCGGFWQHTVSSANAESFGSILYHPLMRSLYSFYFCA